MIEDIKITVSGRPMTGKSTICCIIYDALISKGIINVKCEDTDYDMIGQVSREKERVLKENGIKILIESQQTSRNI